MSSDGKMLEKLVAVVEEALLPAGFVVTPNRRVYNDNGVQIAELDIDIRGKIGSTDFAWLIECRDRPSDGPAGGDWIEQLATRRGRFGFNKVTAVSTQGFAEGARDLAKDEDIELRELLSVDPAELSSWLQAQFMIRAETRTNLKHFSIEYDDGQLSDDAKAALIETLRSHKADTPLMLKSSKTGELVEPQIAFLNAVNSEPQLSDGLVPNGPPKAVNFRARYKNDADHFVIATSIGDVRIPRIVFRGELTLIETMIPLAMTAQYANVGSTAAISQYAAFAPFDVHGEAVSLEFHRLAESGETIAVVRGTETKPK